jgi:signal transduction histidine kinase
MPSQDKNLRYEAHRLIAQRSIASILLSFLLFIIFAVVTPVNIRYFDEILMFGIFLFLLSLFRLAVIYFRDKFEPAKTASWRTLSVIGILLAGVAWGSLSATIIGTFTLGWTSFVIMLMTSALSATYLAVLTPSFKLQAAFHSLLLLPPLFVALVFVHGTRGYVISGFFLGFWLLMLAIGKIQHLQYWESKAFQEKLQVMVNSLPGTMAWVQHDLTYLGVNSAQASLWGLKPQDFVGKSMGFTNQGSSKSLGHFARELFDREELTLSGTFERNERMFYITGQKYKFDKEAVIMGFDITDQELVQSESKFQKMQSMQAGKLSNMGEMASQVIEEMETPVEMIKDKLQEIRNYAMATDDEKLKELTEGVRTHMDGLMTLQKGVTRLLHGTNEFKQSELGIENLIEQVRQFFSFKADKYRTEFQLKCPSGVKFECRESDFFQVLVNLVNNSFDAISELDERWVRIEVDDKGDELHISVIDSGFGIHLDNQSKIFEPLFTKKDDQVNQGMGLTHSKKIIEGNGGRLELNIHSPNTRFEIIFPRNT